MIRFLALVKKYEPAFRVVFLFQALFLAIVGLKSYSLPLPLFGAGCIALGYVFGKHLMPWVGEDKRSRDLREAHARMAKLEEALQQKQELELQAILSQAAHLSAVGEAQKRMT